MTDTIGWGDVDVEPRRRLLPRGRRLLALPAAALVVAGIVLVPRVTSHLAGTAAAWLQREWRVAATYDVARTDIVSYATRQAATGDGPLFAEIVRDVDRDEAHQLSRVATSIHHHRGWAADVSRAQRAAEKAVRAEVRDLLAQATRPQVFFSGAFYADLEMTAPTQALVAQADRLIHASSTLHHVRVAQPPSAHLTGADVPLAQLHRLTPAPLPWRLVVAHDGDLDVWNLLDGSVRRNIADIRLDDGFSIRRVGDSILTLANGRWALVPVSGERHVALPRAADYLPAGSDGLWEVDGSVVRRLDAHAVQLGPTYAMPAGFEAPFAATADAIVISRVSEQAGTLPYLWTPATGHLMALRGACDASASAAGHEMIYMTCEHDPQLVVMDTRTGRTRLLRAPAGLQPLYGTQLLSPDGRHLAAEVTRGDNYEESQPSTFAVWDIDTGEAELVRQEARPLAWSPDGSVLVVNTNFDSGGTSNLPLAYWTPGATGLAPIRIGLTDTSDTVVLLPPG